jgi:hypothetical protein
MSRHRAIQQAEADHGGDGASDIRSGDRAGALRRAEEIIHAAF